MLFAFIGWTDDEVLRWAKRFKDDMADESSDFYHEPPEFYVADLLVPKKFWGKHRGLEIAKRVELVLLRVLEKATIAAFDDIDWRPARDEIDRLLRAEGESLDVVAKEKAGWLDRQDEIG